MKIDSIQQIMNQALSHTLNNQKQKQTLSEAQKESQKTELSEKELNNQMLDYLKDATFNTIMESRPDNDNLVQTDLKETLLSVSCVLGQDQ